MRTTTRALRFVGILGLQVALGCGGGERAARLDGGEAVSFDSAEAAAGLPAADGEARSLAGMNAQAQASLLIASAEYAGTRFDVPSTLLRAIGHVETGLRGVESKELEEGGQGSAVGVMALNDEQVRRGAELAGASEDQVRTIPSWNIAAAAALLDFYADSLGVDRTRLSTWAPVVAHLSGIADSTAREAYVRQGVYGTLARGAHVYGVRGDSAAVLLPVIGLPPPSNAAVARGGDYPAAVWRPALYYTNRPTGERGSVLLIIIHTCEGNYFGCWGWFRDPKNPYKTSAHYVVNGDGSEIAQTVREKQQANHVKAAYDCALNYHFSCKHNGRSTNAFTVGIEHAGYASQAHFHPGQVQASAKLACDIARDHGVPIEQTRFVAHGALQPKNRLDPGKNWPWKEYLALIARSCGSASP